MSVKPNTWVEGAEQLCRVDRKEVMEPGFSYKCKLAIRSS